MLGHVVSATVLATAVSLQFFAASDHATFVLHDGQRVSGAVHGLSNNALNVAADDGRSFSIAFHQIAVIDFGRSQPSPAEFQMLPADNSMQLLVLVSGFSQKGHLIGGGGGSLVWLNEAGQQQPYAMRDVARVYINPVAARSVFNVFSAAPYSYTPYPPYSGPTPGYTPSPYYGGVPGAVGTSGAQTYAPPVTVSVPGDRGWIDTGIMVRAGEMVMFRVSGQIQFRRGMDGMAGPDGNGAFVRATYPVPSAPVGTLIGRVGNDPPFAIGSQTQPLWMPANGRLVIGINDDEFDDNGGAFSVTITPMR